MSTTSSSLEDELYNYSSADKLEKTNVFMELSTPPERPPTMHGDGTLSLISIQLPKIRSQPRAGGPYTAGLPPFDPKQIPELLGPNGPPSSA